MRLATLLRVDNRTSAHALAQHCCTNLAKRLQHHATFTNVGSKIWPFSNLSQQHPTCRNTVAKRTQHVAPDNVWICCVWPELEINFSLNICGCCMMLKSFGQGRATMLRPGMRTSSIFNSQHVATLFNKVAKRVQHVAPNNVAICCVQMLPSFGLGLQILGQQCCDMLRWDVAIVSVWILFLGLNQDPFSLTTLTKRIGISVLTFK